MKETGRWGAWLVLIAAVLAALFAYRYFRIPAELRFGHTAAIWQAGPYVLVAALSAVVLWGQRGDNEKGS